MGKAKRSFLNILTAVLTLTVLLGVTRQVFAELIYIELFENTVVDNNSNTTPATAYGQIVDQPVTFQITASSTINAAILPDGGKKYLLLYLPEEMIGQVALEPFEVQTIVSVPVSNLLGGLNTVVIALINNPLLGILFRNNLTTALANVMSFENFGAANFMVTGQWSTNQLAVGEIDGQLGPLLANDLKSRLNALKAVVNSIPLGALLLSPTLNAIDNLLTAIDSGSLVSELAETAILGSTSATIPTRMHAPTISQGAYTAEFRTGILWSSALPENDVVAKLKLSPIYFDFGQVTWQDQLLPEQLNFGRHLLQTKDAEEWIATLDGQQQSIWQTGKILVEDTTVGENSWQLSVQQVGEWQNGASLLPAQLFLHFGNLITTLPSEVLSVSNDEVFLEAGLQQTLLEKMSSPSNGTVELDIQQFRLNIAADTLKVTGQYQTELNWTLTYAP